MASCKPLSCVANGRPRLHALAQASRSACLGAVAVWLVAGAVVPSSAFAQPAPASSQEARSFDIPAGPLEGVLNRLGRETGVLITFGSTVADGVSTRPRLATTRLFQTGPEYVPVVPPSQSSAPMPISHPLIVLLIT